MTESFLYFQALNSKYMIKLAYILTPVDYGGAEKVSLTFLNYVDRSLFDIQLVLLTRPWENENFFIQALQRKFPIVQLPVAKRPMIEGRDYLRVLRCFKNLLTILKNEKIQLVHTNGYFADIIGVPAAKMLGIAHVSTCHGFITNDSKLNFYNKLDRAVLHFSDKIIAVSEPIKQELEKCGIRKSKVALIQNAPKFAIEKKEHQYARNKNHTAGITIENTFTIGYVGRISKEKGVEYLVEAGVRLFELGEPYRMLIVGEGPEREKLEEAVKAKRLQDNIIFTGFQANVEDWVALFDLFVLPSLTEGTPMALLEAMAMGVPVVATKVGGVPQIIRHGETGFLVSPKDPESIAQKIMYLSGNDQLQEYLSKNAKKLIEKNYNVEQWCRRIESLYLGLTK